MKKTKKEIALELLAPYYADPSTCGYDEEENSCMYITANGNMCVAGKCMIDPDSFNVDTSIWEILNKQPEEKVFKKEYVGIFSQSEWSELQRTHDCIAKRNSKERLRYRIKTLNLFTLEELETVSEKLKP